MVSCSGTQPVSPAPTPRPVHREDPQPARRPLRSALAPGPHLEAAAARSADGCAAAVHHHHVRRRSRREAAEARLGLQRRARAGPTAQVAQHHLQPPHRVAPVAAQGGLSVYPSARSTENLRPRRRRPFPTPGSNQRPEHPTRTALLQRQRPSLLQPTRKRRCPRTRPRHQPLWLSGTIQRFPLKVLPTLAF